MDIGLIASTAVSAIVPYLIMGGEELAKGIGKDLWELIKKPFTSDKDKETLEQLKQNPEDQKLQGKVEGKLEELLKANIELAQQLQSILPKVKEDEERIKITIRGKNIIQGSNIRTGGDLKVGDN